MAEGQYLQAKIKIFEIHWDVVKMINGGERGIRTPDTVTRILAFQASPFNHSGTSPKARHYTG